MYLLADFQVYDRPGFFGKRRVEKEEQYNKQFPDGWEECWQVGDRIYTFWEAVMLYEDAYYHWLVKMPDHVKWVTSFYDCFDHDKKNIEDGIFYDTKQPVRHLQDIAVRRVLLRLGTYFQGTDPDNLLEIRGKGTNGFALMPGLVEFHKPELIRHPPEPCGEVPFWVKEGSVEDFWQRNKVVGKYYRNKA